MTRPNNDNDGGGPPAAAPSKKTQSPATTVRRKKREIEEITIERTIPAVGNKKARRNDSTASKLQSTAQKRWDSMYEQLCAYKKEYGDCFVPVTWQENKPLSSWVNGQRTKYKNYKLTQDQISKMNSIGFCWDVNKYKWESTFDKLCAYINDHGDSLVPQQWEEDKQLGAWVMTQRRLYKKGSLPEERITKLNSIGFSWNPNGPSSEDANGSVSSDEDSLYI